MVLDTLALDLLTAAEVVDVDQAEALLDQLHHLLSSSGEEALSE